MTNEEIDEFILKEIGRGVSTAAKLQESAFGKNGEERRGREWHEKNMRAIDKSLQRLRRKNLIEHRNRAWHVVAPSKS